MDENLSTLIAQIAPQAFTVVAGLGAAYLTYRATTANQVRRIAVEDRRRAEDLRIRAIERGADLLQSDGPYLLRQLHRALRGEAREVDQDPGIEAISLLKIYFSKETAEPLDEYAKERGLAFEELRKCGLQSVMSRAENMATRVYSITDAEREVLRLRDSASALMLSMDKHRSVIIERLAELMGQQLQASTRTTARR